MGGGNSKQQQKEQKLMLTKLNANEGFVIPIKLALK